MRLKPIMAVIIGLTATSAASAADYRVENQVWGGYQIDGTINSPLFGSQPINFNSDLDYDSAYTQGNTAGALPEAAAFDRVFHGNSAIGAGDILKSAYAKSDWGFNHAGVETIGFIKAEKETVSYPIDPNYGSDNILDYNNPITINTSTNTYTVANSRWEELYQISGGVGADTAHITMHVDGFLNGVLSNGDSAQINYNLSTFNNVQVLGLYASLYINSYTDYVYNEETGDYDAIEVNTQNWSKSIFQNGTWNYSYGTGALTIDDLIEGDYDFTYGDPLYLNSNLQTYVWGNGISDFKNTVTMDSFVLPENANVYALSGANPEAYHIGFAGNGGGTVCTSLECVNNGLGNGNGVPSVPVPASIWLFGSALAGLGLNRRRQLAAI
ncbi:MAG: VPLPA-CTERM sorting domain-containing protein [Methylococcaceae bacterium]|nr:VPLPA-CTERM sorting domain-containing protein [Methylococcaceae bacterium]MDP3904890.1 VPLPA-CTERM sorting domain-containing protein [Methylococcaceae bacterium]